MKAIFDNYDRVIAAVIAILAIIGIVTATMPLMQENYKSINTQMMAKVGNEDSTPSGGGNGGGSAPSQTDYGINIMQWDVSKNQDNSVVANYYVKEENQHPQQSQNAVVSLFKPMTAYAANNKTVTIDGVTYTLSDDDTIVISGSGEMMENLQSKLCDYSAIERDVKNHFASDFKYFDDNNITFYAYDSNTGDYKEGIFQTNGTAKIGRAKINDILYGRSNVYDGFYDSNSPVNKRTYLDDSIANKILTFENNVNEYVSKIASNYSVAQPKNLVVAEGITNIGKNAFRNCSNLTNVQLPSTLKSIDYGAFSITNLEAIEIPNSVTTIGKAAFACCYNLKRIKMPNSLTTIGNQVFQQTTSLKEVDLSNTKITTIPYALFVKSNIETVILPNSLVEIGDSSFFKCKKLTNINIPTNLKKIGIQAFEFCDSLKEINLSNSKIESVGENCFSDTPINKIIFPTTLKRIDAGAFQRTNITEIDLSNDNIKLNGRSIFYECKYLQKVKLPKTLTNIPEYTFCKCTLLNDIMIPNTVLSIGVGAFDDCTSIKDINIPDSVTSIGDSAFDGATGIMNMNYIKNLTEINQYAFNGIKVTSFRVADGVTKIGRNSFNNCTELTEVYIPKTVTSIDIYSFYTIAPNLTIYCENQAVADLFKDGTNYKSSITKIVVDATKFA